MARGFTLFEILVVLAIVGLLAGTVLPELQRVASSVEINNQRTDIKLAIERLGYQAYTSGKPIVLAKPTAGGAGAVDKQVELPPGWQIEILQPVHYAVNGVCGGGKIAMTDPNHVREAFVLKPPQCRLEAGEDSQ